MRTRLFRRDHVRQNRFLERLLYIHEALYKLARKFSRATNSADTRLATALLFSEGVDLRRYAGLWQKFTWNEGFYGDKSKFNFNIIELPRDGELKFQLESQSITEFLGGSLFCLDMNRKTLRVEYLSPQQTQVSMPSRGCDYLEFLGGQVNHPDKPLLLSLELDGRVLLTEFRIFLQTSTVSLSTASGKCMSRAVRNVLPG